MSAVLSNACLKWPIRSRVWRFAAIAISTASCAAAGPRPDYFTARTFAYSLQQAFQAQHGVAFVHRIDSDAMKNRVFAPFGREMIEDRQTKVLWDDALFPSLRGELEVFDEQFTFLLGRVALLDNARWIEGLLLDRAGGFRFIYLRLMQAADGNVRIDDVRFGGSELESTRAMRQIFILLGARPPRSINEEEMTLADLSANHPMLWAEILGSIGAKDLDRAFKLMVTVPEKLQRTRIWVELRNRLALRDCAPAMAHLQEACVRGEPMDAFLRYTVIAADGDDERTAQAFDVMLEEYHHPAFLRTVKAELLVKRGRAEEALALAREIYRTNPTLGSVYSIGIHAAIACNQRSTAFEFLDEWAAFVPRDQINAALREDQTLQAFLTEADYLAWRDRADSALTTPATH